MSELSQFLQTITQSLRSIEANSLKNAKEIEMMLLRFYRKQNNPEKIAEVLDARQSRIKAIGE